jgi:DNA-binding LacI/PurR family transcriptional regulator
VAFKQLIKYHTLEMGVPFLVANDLMALSVIQVSDRGNVNIPERLGVVGMDGMPKLPISEKTRSAQLF